MLSSRFGYASLLSLLTTSVLLVGCSQKLPPRPVPLPEAQPTAPGWFPEKPWNEGERASREFYGGKVVFDTNRATIRAESAKVLTQLVEYLKQNPDISRVRLEGHTDSRASDEHNQKLSERRALAVADWLVDHGLDHERLIAVAFGESRPLAPNDNAAGRQENRRASFHIAEVGGHRFRGQDPAGGGLVIYVKSKDERTEEKKVGEVPTAEPPSFTPEGDVFKPLGSTAPSKGKNGDEKK
jgi:outer membrane protein OmpA-like peptidoglycan-associated protein